ncbi:hypothetical protein RFI_05825 [Reticulomyxa filosa]|uniref:Uncharacterized protein n=1 Tax=Reticulomyxa filosa TaxID=46433 RepID=X6NY97_RETFI|nr:hypothetical protein RFI_05825 [Reticulomyxa filosa]|eukprot:ETO31295.1 hypothetical protein RFI_05825 [Reticulomyxa filosa]
MGISGQKGIFLRRSKMVFDKHTSIMYQQVNRLLQAYIAKSWEYQLKEIQVMRIIVGFARQMFFRVEVVILIAMNLAESCNLLSAFTTSDHKVLQFEFILKQDSHYTLNIFLKQKKRLEILYFEQKIKNLETETSRLTIDMLNSATISKECQQSIDLHSNKQSDPLVQGENLNYKKTFTIVQRFMKQYSVDVVDINFLFLFLL